MTSYLEQLTDNLGCGLTSVINGGMNELRDKDRLSRELLNQINREEARLLDELKEVTKYPIQFNLRSQIEVNSNFSLNYFQITSKMV